MRRKLFFLVMTVITAVVVSFAFSESSVIQTEETSVLLGVGKTQKISYTLQAPEDYGKAQKAEWVSSDETVATVQGGNIRGVSAGKAEITLTVPFSNGEKATEVFAVTVFQPLQSIAFEEKQITMFAGEVMEAPAPVLKPENVTYAGIGYSSDHDEIVAAEGHQFRALQKGKATITAVTDEPLFGNGKPKTAKLTITVVQQALVFSPESEQMEIGRGGTETLTYTMEPEDVSNPKLQWSSSDEGIATVNNGKVSAKSAGEAVITAATTDGSELVATWQITVFEPVDRIELNEKNLTLTVGQRTEKPAYTIYPDGAKYTDVTWQSSNEYVATVDQGGRITARHTGRATITATSTEPAGSSAKKKEASIQVTVTAPIVEEHSEAYQISEDGTLEAYTGTETNVVIPNGVTAIENWCFTDHAEIETVFIPDSVIEIGQGVFYRCSGLKEVRLPDQIEILPYQAFCLCSALKEITLPESLKIMEDNVFYGCDSLEKINIPQGTTEIGKAAFYNCGELKEITIPETVHTIQGSAFEECTALESLIFPEGLTTIKEDTCKSCRSLKTIAIPSTVEKIGQYTFGFCNELETVIMPNGLLQIGERAFQNCRNLKEIRFPCTLEIIRDHAFEACSSLTEISFPENLSSIGMEAFLECTGLQRVTIPDSVTDIGMDAFYSSEAMNRITVRGSRGSYAELYAESNYHFFEAVNLITSTLERYQDDGLTELLSGSVESMETVKTDGSEDVMMWRFAPRVSGRTVNGFSAYQPNVKGEDVTAQINDLTLSADRLLFQMYDFQQQGISEYGIDEPPLQMEMIQSLMKESWHSLASLDFAAGYFTNGGKSWYWIPVYYEDEEGRIWNDEMYLYILKTEEGSDQAFLQEMSVYCPFEGEYRTEETLITAKEDVIRFLDAMKVQNDYNGQKTDARMLRKLKEGQFGKDIKDIQRRLAKQGYLSGSVDGYYGPSTTEAVQAWQKAHLQEITGEVDQALQVILLNQQEDKELLAEWIERNRADEEEENRK